MNASGVWAGVDVGGRRKGFHAAVVDDRQLVAGPAALPDAAAVTVWLMQWQPLIVAVDSPCRLAGDCYDTFGEIVLPRAD